MLLAPPTSWRIPEDINVVPVPPPARRIRLEDMRILNARRAGNRGKRNSLPTEPFKTTLIFRALRAPTLLSGLVAAFDTARPRFFVG